MDANTLSNVVIAVATVVTTLGAIAVPVIIGWVSMKKDVSALRERERELVLALTNKLETLSNDVNELKTSNAVMQSQLADLKSAQAATVAEVAQLKQDLTRFARDGTYVKHNIYKEGAK